MCIFHRDGAPALKKTTCVSKTIYSQQAGQPYTNRMLKTTITEKSIQQVVRKQHFTVATINNQAIQRLV